MHQSIYTKVYFLKIFIFLWFSSGSKYLFWVTTLLFQGFYMGRIFLKGSSCCIIRVENTLVKILFYQIGKCCSIVLIAFNTYTKMSKTYLILGWPVYFRFLLFLFFDWVLEVFLILKIQDIHQDYSESVTYC